MPSSSEVDLFIEKHDKIINTQNVLIVFLILSSVIYFLIYGLSPRFLLRPEIVQGASVIYVVVFMGVFLYVANIRMRIRDGDELTYGLCKIYTEMGRVGGRGKQSKEKLEDVKRELVKGPIKYLRSAIKEVKAERPLPIFSSKFVSLLEKAQKSLIHQIYPILHKGKIKDIPKARDYLLAIIETRINGDFDRYEVALDNLGKGLPVEEVKISEMRTYVDVMKNWLHVTHGIWGRSLFLKFLTFCGCIGAVFYVASFFVQISPEVALMTTIGASAVLSAASISR